MATSIRITLRQLQVGALVAAAFACPVVAGAQATDVVTYLHTDALGSVRMVTDSNAQVLTRHDYAPFGEEPQPSSNANRRRFAGKERDTETGYDYFGGRYYAGLTGRFTTVDPVQTWPQNLVDPQRWNRYAYARDNPLRYIDPDGRAIDTIVDILSIGYDLFDIGRSVVRGEGVSRTQTAALGADVLGAAVPFVTGGGLAIRAAARADNALEIARGGAAAVRAGQAGEAAVRAAVDIGPKAVIDVAGRTRIPDGLTRTVLSEVKNVGSLSYTQQLRDYAQFAKDNGLRFDLYVPKGAGLSGPLREARDQGLINIVEIKGLR